MYEILFICSANVGRSQIAEGFYNYYSGGKKSISAAAIEDKREKYNNRPHPDIIKVMREKGIDISNQKIKLVNHQIIKNAKRIIVLCDIKKCPMFLKKNKKIQIVFFEDPYSSNNQILQFRETRNLIEKLVLQLVN